MHIIDFISHQHKHKYINNIESDTLKRTHRPTHRCSQLGIIMFAGLPNTCKRATAYKHISTYKHTQNRLTHECEEFLFLSDDSKVSPPIVPHEFHKASRYASVRGKWTHEGWECSSIRQSWGSGGCGNLTKRQHYRTTVLYVVVKLQVN